jgi:hypothetical protein
MTSGGRLAPSKVARSRMIRTKLGSQLVRARADTCRAGSCNARPRTSHERAVYMPTDPVSINLARPCDDAGTGQRQASVPAALDAMKGDP